MKKILGIIDKIFKTLAGCVTPAVPILIGVGMLKVGLILFGPSVLGILQESDNTYVVLTFVADAGYYFLPIYIAVASAEYLNTSKYIAALMGGVLLSPKFVELINEGASLTVFGLPIASISYANEILPSIVIVCIESYIYKFIDSLVTEKFKNIIVPLFVIIIMVPIIFCAVGPLGILLSQGLTKLILALTKIGPFGVGIYAALLPFAVMFGLGGTNLTVILSIASQGADPICFFSNVIYNCTVGSVALAYYVKHKDAESLAAGVTGIVGGISEPALFGVALKDRKALLATVIGNFVGGFLVGLFKVKTFAVASFGVLGVIATIGEGSSIVLASISLLAACATGFVLYYLSQINKKNKELS